VHIPDGFINAGTSVAAGALAVGTMAVAVRRTRATLGERQVPLAALTAAFTFAVQMLNFPVASGTSGHFLGGVLAAALVGPWAGAIAVAVVLAVQAVLFADGGLSALGLNIVNLSLVATLGGYLLLLALRRLLPAGPGSLPLAAGVAACASVPMAAAAFTLQLAVGGNADVALSSVAVAMVGTHVLIGIGEGVITAMALGAVLAARPDLVHAADPVAVPLELRTAGAST
jgi:cobalt/nickel transport system permease protein